MTATPSSHLVLARKWRPDRFGELVGQEHVTRTLVQALSSGRIAHAFLFTGIRGVGKTTAARILARCLNCKDGPTAEPCGNCAACQEIRAGSSLDVVEIDGATYRKIDDARAIIENLSYRPARDRFKIYIIDEAHQLTDQAFNALLKTLEEPPAHVKFILATTEPQKMPETILSRLQRYDFRRIPFAVIRTRLKELGGREGIESDDASLSLLAREAGGSMRDAERMLETAIASLDGKVTESEVASILGVASRSRVFELIAAVLAKDAATALAAVRELHRCGANLESLGRDILEVIRNLTVAKLPGASGPRSPLADLPDQEAAELRRLAQPASLRDLMRLFHLMADAQEQLLRSPYPDLLIEMAVVRMATLAPVMDADELMRAIAAAPVTADGGAAPPPSSAAPPASSVPLAGTTRAAPASAAEARPGPVGARRIPIEGDVKADAPRRAAPPAAPPARQPERSAPSSPSLPPATLDLRDLRDFIRGRRAALAGFMEQGAALELNGDGLTVTPRNDIYIRYLTDNRNVIAELASEFYARLIRAEIAPIGGNAPANTAPPPATIAPAVIVPMTANAAAAVAEPRPDASATASVAAAPPLDVSSPNGDGGVEPAPRQTQAEARQALYADPVVRRIFDEFEARLVEVRGVQNPPARISKEAPAEEEE
jgi:DNA polymerase III subunit gamma/tau